MSANANKVSLLQCITFQILGDLILLRSTRSMTVVMNMVSSKFHTCQYSVNEREKCYKNGLKSMVDSGRFSYEQFICTITSFS